MNALHLAFLLRPEGQDIDQLVAKLEGESLDLPIIEAIRLYAEPNIRSWNQDKNRMENYHSGKTVSRVMDALMPPDDDPGPSMLAWSVEKAIGIAEANAIRRARFPNNRPPGRGSRRDESTA
jgi:hypothetical protein